MPQIDVAMAASLRSGSLFSRDIATTASNVGQSFSSWDNCMNAPYCKWPVIAAIIVGALIVLSVATCIARAVCCGVSCCCECFRCLQCSDCCSCCCDPPGGRRRKHLDEASDYPPPHQGYRAPVPMMAGGLGAEPPKYAQFEVGPNGHYVEPKRLNDDALPPMPSWDTAAKKHVALEEGAHEMNNLDPKTGQEIPLMSGGVGDRTGSPVNAISPVHSPYEDGPGAAHDGYMGAVVTSPGATVPGTAGPYGYGPGAMGAGTAAVVGAGAGVMAMGGGANGRDPYRQNGPGQRGGYNGAAGGRGYGPSPEPYSPVDGNGRGQGFDDYHDPYAPGPSSDYGPTPVAGGAYGLSRGPPRRQNTGDSAGTFSNPQRQYGAGMSPPMLAPSPQHPYSNEPIAFPDEQAYMPNRGPGRAPMLPHSNSGFDFGEAVSRPQPMPSGEHMLGGPSSPPRRPVPPPQQQNSSYSSSGPPIYGRQKRRGDRDYAGDNGPRGYDSRAGPSSPPSGGGYPPYREYSRPQPGRLNTSEGQRREHQGWEGV
jgi:hypothetical protein